MLSLLSYDHISISYDATGIFSWTNMFSNFHRIEAERNQPTEQIDLMNKNQI